MTEPAIPDPVGVLSVRIWRDERDAEVIRVRVMSKLDVLDPGPPEFSYPSSPAGINDAVVSWFRRFKAYTATTGPTGS